MRYPYPLRLTLPAMLLVFGFVLAIIFGWDDLRTSGAAIEQESLHHMESLGNRVSGKLEYSYQNNEPESAAWDISLLASEPYLRHAIVYDNMDQVIAATDPALINGTMGESMAPVMAELPDLARQTNAAQIRLSDDGNTYSGTFPFRLNLLPGEVRPSRIGVLCLELDLQEQKQAQFDTTVQHIALIGAFILPLLAAMWFYFDRTVTRRAAQLITVTGEMAAGNLDRRASLRGSDELARLGDSYNAMAESIQSQTDLIISSEEKYHGLFEESKDTVIITAATGEIIDINPTGVELFGFDSQDEILGINMGQELYAEPEDREQMLKDMRQRGFLKDYDLNLKTRNGELLRVSASLTPELDDEGDIIRIRGVLHDMTERQQLEELLRQSQKLESIGQLAGGVAHDFNNYLTAIEGYIDLALAGLPADSPVRQDLMESRNSADRAANLARQLLIFSRREAISPKPINPNTTISDLLKMLPRLIGEQYSLTTSLTDDPWTINADAAQLEQVIMNLTVNARDAMPQGGTITISSENFVVTPEYAREHGDSRPGEFFHIAVKDAGAGMDAMTRSHIFEPFFTTKSPGRGTGLGLSVVYGIITQHKGWIEVDSQPRHGSTFNIFLPALPFERSISESEPTELEHYQGHGEKILLVEDEDEVRKLGEKILSQNGYRVTAAASAEEALAIFEESGGDFQLVFSDVILPRENGIGLVARLQERQPGLRVLLASGYSDIAGQEIIRRRGYPFLAKPYALQALLEKVAGLLG